jgi:metal-sulfur cluster biosynthetic enzyme
VLSWLRDRATRQAAGGQAAGPYGCRDVLDPDVLDCLLDVLDPEVGVSVVHLGLVYRAVRSPERIDIDLTLTTRTCPLGGMIVDDARDRLGRRFNDCPAILVRLVWSPAWTPDRITDLGLALLGHPTRALP